jgi:hypothetical protein
MKKTKSAQYVHHDAVDLVNWVPEKRRNEFREWVPLYVDINGMCLKDTYGKIMAFVTGTKYEPAVSKTIAQLAKYVADEGPRVTGFSTTYKKVQVKVFLLKQEEGIR